MRKNNRIQYQCLHSTVQYVAGTQVYVAYSHFFTSSYVQYLMYNLINYYGTQTLIWPIKIPTDLFCFIFLLYQEQILTIDGKKKKVSCSSIKLVTILRNNRFDILYKVIQVNVAVLATYNSRGWNVTKKSQRERDNETNMDRIHNYTNLQVDMGIVVLYLFFFRPPPPSLV